VKKAMRVGILLYNEVEVLDFAGPFEVFSITTYKGTQDKPFDVSTVAETSDVIKARNGLRILPDYTFSDAPTFDILIIPGGYGAEEIEIHNKEMINWIKDQSKNVKLLASVCTGAFLLATAKLLDGKKATTHWLDIERLEKEFENVEVLRDVKYVDQGNIITAAGISAGINMSFHIIERVLDVETARETARRMEYDLLMRR
jgi:transcriptional regulator GlxA family with amidase domain